MIARRILKWIAFWLFVIFSWAAAGFYFLISGGSSCEPRDTCTQDTAVSILTVLLLPGQVLVFVLLRHRTGGD